MRPQGGASGWCVGRQHCCSYSLQHEVDGALEVLDEPVDQLHHVHQQPAHRASLHALQAQVVVAHQPTHPGEALLPHRERHLHTHPNTTHTAIRSATTPSLHLTSTTLRAHLHIQRDAERQQLGRGRVRLSDPLVVGVCMPPAGLALLDPLNL